MITTPTSEWRSPEEIEEGSLCFCLITAVSKEEYYYYVAIKTYKGWQSQEGDIEEEPDHASLIYSA